MKPPIDVEHKVLNTMLPQKVTPIDGGWNITGINFESVCGLHSDETWSFIDGGNSVSFKFAGLRWDTGEVVKSGAEHNIGVLTERKSGVSILYQLGDGISVEIIQDNFTWKKIVHIDSIQSLGEIPGGAQHLEVVFDLVSSFEIPTGKIVESMKLAKHSAMQPVRAWDANGDETKATAFVELGEFTKGMLVEWLLNAAYPVSIDAVITFGAENVFNAATTEYVSVAALDYSVAALDSTHFVVAYRDSGNSNYGTAIVGVVSGTTISSYGAENVFNEGNTTSNGITALDSANFVVAYRDIGNLNHGTAIAGLVSGTTISSYGAENVFNAASTDYVSVSALDSTHFTVCYEDEGNSSHGTAIAGSIPIGTVIPTIIHHLKQQGIL